MALMKIKVDGRNPPVTGVEFETGKYAGHVLPVDSDGNEGVTINNLGMFPLKADQSSATANTNVVTVSQAGIKYADLYNPHSTITMYVWFGADPSAGSQIPIPPGGSISVDVDDKADMRYKSSAAGGILGYILRG